MVDGSSGKAKNNLDLKAETPARGVYLRKEFPNSIWFGVACECSDEEHNHEVWVESDPEFDFVSVHVFTTTHTRHSQGWGTTAWKRFTEKVRYTIDLWFRGYIETEASIMMDRQVAINYADVLKKSIQAIESEETRHVDRSM